MDLFHQAARGVQWEAVLETNPEHFGAYLNMSGMMRGIHEGGCLCGTVRYRTQGEPIRVTICHCRFCQRATGGAYMVEPIFRLGDVRVTRGVPSIYTHT